MDNGHENENEIPVKTAKKFYFIFFVVLDYKDRECECKKVACNRDDCFVFRCQWQRKTNSEKAITYLSGKYSQNLTV